MSASNRAFNTDSDEQNAERYVRSRESLRYCEERYVGRDIHGSNPFASPQRAQNHSELRAATVVTAGFVGRGTDRTKSRGADVCHDMIKMVDLLVRREDYSHEEFVDRWQGDHADLAKDLPGLRRYVTSVPANPDRADFDGVLELYFDDVAALNEAFASEVGETVQADAAEFIDMETGPRVIVEETVQLDERHD